MASAGNCPCPSHHVAAAIMPFRKIRGLLSRAAEDWRDALDHLFPAPRVADAPRPLRIIRLEKRRVLSADFAMIGGALLLDGFEGDDASLTISQDSDSYLFTNDGGWDSASSVAGATVEGDTLVVDRDLLDAAPGGLAVVGDSTSRLEITIGEVDFSGLDGAVSLLGASSIGQATDSQVTAPDSGFALSTSSSGLTLTSLNVAGDLTIFSDGDITDAPGTQITISGNATFISRNGGITLADSFTDTLIVGGEATFDAYDGVTRYDISVGEGGWTEFGDLTALGASVGIEEDAAARLERIDAASFSLLAAGEIDTTTGATIDVLGDASLTSTSTFNRADYDNNGLVDSGDYDAWTASYGSAGDNLAADGNRDGVVDVADYGVWRAALGEFETGGGIAVTAATRFDVGGHAALVARDGAGSYDITVGDPVEATFGTLTLWGAAVAVYEDSGGTASGTDLAGVTAESLMLVSDGRITDTADAVVVVAANADLIATQGMRLADGDQANRVEIGGLISFLVDNDGDGPIEVGEVPDGAPDTATFTAGSLRFAYTSFLGARVEIIEADSMEIGAFEGGIFDGLSAPGVESGPAVSGVVLYANGSITDSPGARVAVIGDISVVAENDIVLADTADSVFEAATLVSAVSVDGSIDLGVAANGEPSGSFEAYLFDFAAPRGDVRVADTLFDGIVLVDAIGGGAETELLGDRAPDLTVAQNLLLFADGVSMDPGVQVDIAGDATIVSGEYDINLAGGDSPGYFRVGGTFSAITDGGDVLLGVQNPTQLSRADFDAGQIRFNTAGGVVSIVESSDTAIASWRRAEIPGVTAPTVNEAAALLLISDGAITDQSGAEIDIAGDAVLEAAGAVTLDESSVNFGTLGLTGTDVLVREASGTNLTGVVADAFDLESIGDIVDEPDAVIDVLGSAILTGNAITLDNTSVNFGDVGLYGGPVTLLEASGTVLSGVFADSFELVSEGRVEDLDDAEIFILGPADIEGALGVALGDGGPANTVMLSFFDLATIRAGDGQSVLLGVDLGQPLEEGEIVPDADADLRVGNALRIVAPGGDVMISDDATEVAGGGLGVLMAGEWQVGALLLQSADAIFDVSSTTDFFPVADVNVDGDATFKAAAGIILADGDTAANRLVVGGVARLIVDSGQNIDVGVNPDGSPADAVFVAGGLGVEAPGGVGRVAVDSAAILTGATAAMDLALAADGAIIDSADADIEVTRAAELNADNGAADVVLGDQSAAFSMGDPDLFSTDEYLAIVAANVSVQADSAVNVRTSAADSAFSGTFYLTAAGDVTQVAGQDGSLRALTADKVSIASEGAVLFDAIELTSQSETDPNLQIKAGGPIDLAADVAASIELSRRFGADLIPSSRETALSPIDVEADQADGTRPDQPARDDQGLENVLVDGDPARLSERAAAGGDPTGPDAPVDIGDAYAAIVRVVGDAIVGDVQDATGAATDADVARGFVVTSSANAYLDTTGSLTFTGEGRWHEGPQVEVVLMAGGVFTAVAGTVLRIDSEDPDDPDPTKRTTLLRSATGSVTSVAPAEQSGFDDAPGPRVILDTPTEEGLAATSGLIRADQDFEQRITLAVGSRGEDNLLIEVEWADTATVRNGSAASVTAGVGPVRESYDLDQVAGSSLYANLLQTPVESIETNNTDTGLIYQDLEGEFRVVTITHNYQQEFVPANPEQDTVPTTVRVYNDPAINLFDQGGERDLNSATVTVAPRIITQPPAGYFLITEADLPIPFAEPTVALPRDDTTTVEARSLTDDSRVVVTASAETVEYGRIDDSGEWLKVVPGETWPQIREDAEGDFLREIRQQIDEGPYSEGRYRIQIRTPRGEQLLEEWTKRDLETDTPDLPPEAAPQAEPDAETNGAPTSFNPPAAGTEDRRGETVDAAFAAVAAVGAWRTRLGREGSFRIDSPGLSYSRVQRRRRRA